MAIPKKNEKAIELPDYREKAVLYPVDTMPEFPKPGEPGYLGPWTPQAPYGKKEQGEEDADR